MILWRNRKQLNLHAWRHPAGFKLPWADIAFIGIVVLIVITRFWAIRSLDLPMWGDSYQHTMIAQLLVDHGGLFTSWQPYTDLNTFTYHFGFHSAVAVFDWITHMDMSQGGAVGGTTGECAGSDRPLPAGDKNWAQSLGRGCGRLGGRAALANADVLCQLGQVHATGGTGDFTCGCMGDVGNLHPRLLSASPGISKGKRELIGLVLIGCIALGGLALTHYGCLILSMIFLIVFWVLYARRDTLRFMLQSTLWVGTGAGLLFPAMVHPRIWWEDLADLRPPNDHLCSQGG